MTGAPLEVQDLVAGYGPVRIVRDVSLRLKEGSVVALIGANGSGKSTTLKAISGLIRPMSGSVVVPEVGDMAGSPPERIARTGVVMVPAEDNVFGALTVRENLLVALYGRFGFRYRPHLGDALAVCFSTFPQLESLMRRKAGVLSGGERRMVAFSRALVTDPNVLLVDEPTLGLSPKYADFVRESLESIAALGKAILLVEQNTMMALELADWVYVLDTGRIGMSGPASEVRDDERVRKLFLGG